MQRIELQITSPVDHAYEEKFAEFIRYFIHTREDIEHYIQLSREGGKTRRQAIAQLHGFGIYLNRASK